MGGARPDRSTRIRTPSRPSETPPQRGIIFRPPFYHGLYHEQGYRFSASFFWSGSPRAMSMGACRDPPHARGERDRRGVRQARPGAASRTTAPVRDTQRGRQAGPRVRGGGKDNTNHSNRTSPPKWGLCRIVFRRRGVFDIAKQDWHPRQYVKNTMRFNLAGVLSLPGVRNFVQRRRGATAGERLWSHGPVSVEIQRVLRAVHDARHTPSPSEKKLGSCTNLMVPSEDQEKAIIKSIDCDKKNNIIMKKYVYPTMRLNPPRPT